MEKEHTGLAIPVIIAVVLLLFLVSGPAEARTNLLVAQADRGDVPNGVVDKPEPSGGLPALTLPQAVEMALSDNQTLQMARQAVEVASAGGRSALAQFLPNLSTTYAYTRLAEANVISVPGVGEFELQGKDNTFWGLTFRYPLYNAGLAPARVAAAAETEAAEFRAEQAEALVRLGVTSAYTGVLEAQAGLEAARKSLEHLDEVLRSAQAHYDAGYLPLSDLLGAEVARSQAEQAVAELERGVEVAQSALAILIGGEIGDRWDLAPVEFPERAVPFPLETLWDWAIGTRPELREIRAEREAIAALIDAVRGAGRPTVDLQADYSRTGSDAFPDDNTALQGMISIRWDLFDFGRTDDLVSPFEEQLALLDIQQTELETHIQQDVESAFLNVRTQIGNLQVSRGAMARAEEAFRVAQRRREEGLGLMLEVLDAEATLARTEAGYIHILHEYYRALATLAQALGTTTNDLVRLIIAAGEEEQ